MRAQGEGSTEVEGGLADAIGGKKKKVDRRRKGTDVKDSLKGKEGPKTALKR